MRQSEAESKRRATEAAHPVVDESDDSGPSGRRAPSRRAVEVGWFEGRSPITVRREPEVGIAWQADAKHFGQAALGKTPHEAVKNLIAALNERGIEGHGHSDTAKLTKLNATKSANA